MSSKMSHSRSASASAQSSKSKPTPPSIRQLRPYQIEIARAILDSVFNRKGLTFSVEIARQGGKNELSAQLELLLLTLYMIEKLNLIKCSPTFRPQAVISMTRLKDRLNDAGFAQVWKGEHGYIIRVVDARAIFLSADESANVVGNTAHLLLEIDESQDVSKEKYTRDFKPMGATTNVTTVHYGTTWDDSTLLEEVKQTIIDFCQAAELNRVFGSEHEVTYKLMERTGFNEDEVRAILEPSGLWARVLSLDQARLKQLLTDEEIARDIINKLNKLKCITATYPQLWVKKRAEEE